MKRRAGMTRGALALGAAGAASKALGAIQRLVIARWLGAETMGLLELALPVLGAGVNLMSLGVPTGLTVWAPAALARDDAQDAHCLRRGAERLLSVAGLLGAIAVAVLAQPLARALGEPAAIPILRVLAVAVAVSVILSGRRAWFTAVGELDRVAASNAVEQLVKVTVSVAAAWLLISAPARRVAAALAWGPALGAAMAMLLLRLPRVPAALRPRLHHYRRLLGTGVPSWAATTFVGATAAIDPALIIWRLRAGGHSLVAATALLGELLGMAMPLATATLVLYGAVTAALLPVVSAARAAGDEQTLRHRVRQAYLWCATLGFPAAAALSVLASPLCALLYHDAAAGIPLTVAAWVAIPLGFSTVATTALTGVGAPEAQLLPLLAGSAVRVGLILVLTSRFGTPGVAWAAVAGWLITAAGNVAAAGRRAGTWPDLLATITGPAVAAALLYVVARWAFTFVTAHGYAGGLATLLALAGGGMAAGVWMLPRLAILHDPR